MRENQAVWFAPLLLKNHNICEFSFFAPLNDIFYFEIKLNEYLIFYKSIYYLCCLIFQATVFFFIFLDLFRTNVSIIKKLRKICYFLFFIFATFVTPPEVLYQLAMSIGIILIYELLIIYMIFKTKLEIFK